MTVRRKGVVRPTQRSLKKSQSVAIINLQDSLFIEELRVMIHDDIPSLMISLLFL